MSGLEVFVDTNLLIRFLAGDESVHSLILENEIFLSFISELELFAKPGLSREDELSIENLLRGCHVVHYSDEMKETIIRIRRTARLKLPDSIIAASAIFHNLTMLTADAAFRRVSGLSLVMVG